MKESVRQHLVALIGVSLLGIAGGFMLLSYIHGAVGTMNVSTFSTWILAGPCAIIFACSFVITATASKIGRQLFVTVVAICVVAGIVSMLVTSAWMSDQAIAAQLLANSPDGTTITPILKSPLTCFRNIAAYFVVSTIGCIAGTWVGSRLHPVQAAADAGGKNKNAKKNKKR